MLGPQNFPGSFSLIYNLDDAFQLPLNSIIAAKDWIKSKRILSTRTMQTTSDHLSFNPGLVSASASGASATDSTSGWS
jgi:hypothetical protein